MILADTQPRVFVRPLGVLLQRIAVRQERMRTLEARNAPAGVIALEAEVLGSLKKEYTSRVARLNRYLALA